MSKRGGKAKGISARKRADPSDDDYSDEDSSFSGSVGFDYAGSEEDDNVAKSGDEGAVSAPKPSKSKIPAACPEGHDASNLACIPSWCVQCHKRVCVIGDAVSARYYGKVIKSGHNVVCLEADCICSFIVNYYWNSEAVVTPLGRRILQAAGRWEDKYEEYNRTVAIQGRKDKHKGLKDASGSSEDDESDQDVHKRQPATSSKDSHGPSKKTKKSMKPTEKSSKNFVWKSNAVAFGQLINQLYNVNVFPDPEKTKVTAKEVLKKLETVHKIFVSPESVEVLPHIMGLGYIPPKPHPPTVRSVQTGIKAIMRELFQYKVQCHRLRGGVATGGVSDACAPKQGILAKLTSDTFSNLDGMFPGMLYYARTTLKSFSKLVGKGVDDAKPIDALLTEVLESERATRRVFDSVVEAELSSGKGQKQIHVTGEKKTILEVVCNDEGVPINVTPKLASSSTATGATATPVRGDSRGEMPKSASRSDKGEPSDGSKSKKARKTSTREDDDIKLDAAERFMLRFETKMDTLAASLAGTASQVPLNGLQATPAAPDPQQQGVAAPKSDRASMLMKLIDSKNSRLSHVDADAKASLLKEISELEAKLVDLL